MLWIGITGHYRLTYEDRAMEAEDQLTRLLHQLDRREESIEASRTKVRSEALALRACVTRPHRCSHEHGLPNLTAGPISVVSKDNT